MARRKSKSAPSPNGRNGKHRARQAPRELEDAIVALAESGQLADASRAEIRAQRAAGLPITYQRGNNVVREYPDGRIEVLETLPPAPPYQLPKGVRRLREANGSRDG